MPFCAIAARGAWFGQREAFETSFETVKRYAIPFVETEADFVFRQGAKQWKVPAFWAGGGKWTVRFARLLQGDGTCRIVCTDKTNSDLTRKEQTLSVTG